MNPGILIEPKRAYVENLLLTHSPAEAEAIINEQIAKHYKWIDLEESRSFKKLYYADRIQFYKTTLHVLNMTVLRGKILAEKLGI